MTLHFVHLLFGNVLFVYVFNYKETADKIKIKDLDYSGSFFFPFISRSNMPCPLSHKMANGVSVWTIGLGEGPASNSYSAMKLNH